MNKGIIQVDGKFYAKSKIILIESKEINKKGDICKFPYGLNIVGKDDIGYPTQHLYFLSDDEIKEGDWVLLPNKILKRMSNDDMIHYIDSMSNATKKIIATTDKSLNINHKGSIGEEYLPRPSNEFLRAYCEQGGIDEVLVEVEDKGKYIAKIDHGNGNEIWNINYNLKVSPDNTIKTKPIKTRWTREEYMQDIKRMVNLYATTYTDGNIDKWIEQNL